MDCLHQQGGESRPGSVCAVCEAVEAEAEKFVATLSDDEDIETLTDNDRALQILIEAVSLFEDLNRGKLLEVRAENLKSSAELTGVQPAIILYAHKHGPLRAHSLFLKKQFRPEPADKTKSL